MICPFMYDIVVGAVLQKKMGKKNEAIQEEEEAMSKRRSELEAQQRSVDVEKQLLVCVRSENVTKSEQIKKCLSEKEQLMIAREECDQKQEHVETLRYSRLC